MGQKVNPTGFRTGINNLWHTEGQCYGKDFRNSKILYRKLLPTTNYLNQLFESKKLIKGKIRSKIKDNKCYYNIDCFSLVPKNDSFIQIAPKFIFSSLDTEVQNYNMMSWYQNGSLLCEFIKTSLAKGLPFRKIVITLKTMFLSKKKHNTVLKTVCGTQFFEFTGLKIKYAGRFGGSRSRMANSIVFKIGSVSLQQLETYIEFHEMPLHTKQGVCSIQVWMSYRISKKTI